MKINLYRLNVNIIYILIIIIISFFVITRDHSIGTDTLAYKDYFDNIDYYSVYQKYEPSFHYLSYLISYVFNNYFIYLFILFILINGVLLKSINNFIVKSNDFFLLSFGFLSFLLLSSWYQVATINGIRQGFSLAFLYLGFSFFYRNKILSALITLIFSFTFHYSSLLIIPFLFFLFLKEKWTFLLFFLTAIFYPLGINEIIIKNISSISGIPLYEKIYTYGEGINAWVGFQLNFYLYSLFYSLLFLFMYFRFYRKEKLNFYILKIFLLLNSAYFIYGFGVYSNRYGIMAWSFLPFMQTIYFLPFLRNYLNDKNSTMIFLLILFLFGFFNYMIVLIPN